MRALHLFAGAGGSVLASRLLGWTSVGCVEWDPYCRRVLRARGERVVGSDIRQFKATGLVGRVDIVVGGSPCQDLSVAGPGEGIDGPRSGLWRAQLRIAEECEAPFIWRENVKGAVTHNGGRDFAVILRQMAKAGYDAVWTVNSASSVGAPHRRERVWVLAHPPGGGLESRLSEREHLQIVAKGPGADGSSGDRKSHQPGLGGTRYGLANGLDWPAARGDWPHQKGPTQAAWEAPRTCGPGNPGRVQRVTALGNGWVPAQAVAAWHELHRVFTEAVEGVR